VVDQRLAQAQSNEGPSCAGKNAKWQEKLAKCCPFCNQVSLHARSKACKGFNSTKKKRGRGISTRRERRAREREYMQRKKREREEERKRGRGDAVEPA